MGTQKTLFYLLIICSFLYAQDFLLFNEGIKLQANNTDINNPFGTPAVADWDNDGIADLLVGEMVNAGPYNYLTGKLVFYKNNGTNESPDLSRPEYVKVNGSDIELTAG